MTAKIEYVLKVSNLPQWANI